MANDEKDLQYLTRKSSREQKRLLRLFAKLTFSQRKDVLKKQRSIFHTLRSRRGKEFDNETLTLASQILAIEEYEDSLDEYELKLLKHNEKKTNKNNKTEKLLVLWAVIKDLKENKNMSFREIANFISDTKFEVSYSLIFQEWKKHEEKGLLL